MKTIEIQVFEFDELSDKAKDVARDWFRSCGLDYEWWDSTCEDAERVGLKITAFDLDRDRHAEGRFVSDAVSCADKVIAEHGPDCETRKTAESFVKERDSIVEAAERDENGEIADVYALDQKLDDCEGEFLKAILEDYSVMLQQEAEYLTSDESVDESIRANEYEFLSNGKPASHPSRRQRVKNGGR